jgi:hypothetical protein
MADNPAMAIVSYVSSHYCLSYIIYKYALCVDCTYGCVLQLRNICVCVWMYVEKTALDCNHQGYGRSRRPKRTWRSTMEDEIRGTRRSCNEVKGIAGDRIN